MTTTALLVSVRSSVEALHAIEGGAGLIDVKEPARGPLGPADDTTIEAVIRHVAGRCPVSAAVGELVERRPVASLPGLAYAKWGLSQCGVRHEWRQSLQQAGERLQRANPECRPVAVAYADWRRAGAPRPGDVLAFTQELGWSAFLIDTCVKDGSTLLDWLSLSVLGELCARCRDTDIKIALAGSLGLEEIGRLLHLMPQWFAVRGAACRGGNRGSEIDPAAVRELARLVRNKAGSRLTPAHES